MAVSLADHYSRLSLGLTLRERDPLSFWHHSSRVTRIATANLANAEIYLRAGNKAGKTEWGAAVTLAVMQRRRMLDGIVLPRVRSLRPLGVVFSLDYPQQLLSVQPTYLRLLGSWPHRARYKRDGILSSLAIKPIGGNDDPSSWGVLHFLSQANLKAGTGARGVHIAHADEPPVERIWREMRKGAHAGQEILRIITATPLLRRQWYWLSQEYQAANEGRIHHGRLELRLRALTQDPNTGALSSDNLALTDADLQKMFWDFENDPLKEARWSGDYIDADNDKPFDGKTLQAMIDAWCTMDPELRKWDVPREVDTVHGRVVRNERVTVEIHVPPQLVTRACYVVIEPSKGIASERHDPGAIIVCEMGTGDVLAVYEGYIGGYGLGILGAALARQYRNAIVDFESNSGWGEGVLRGLAAAGYGNISQTQRLGTDGQWEPDLGFVTSTKTRPAMMQAIQEWIAAFRVGAAYGRCPSRRILNQLIDIIVDKNGKTTAAPGLHDDLMIARGQSLRKTIFRQPDALDELAHEATRARKIFVPGPPKDDVSLDKLVKEAMGEGNGHGAWGARAPALRYRPRPRL